MKRLIIAALAASTFAATPAFAESVTFNGNRAVECSVTGYSGTINFGNLGRNGQASPVTDSGINVFCNQPFKAAISSTNGYLKLNGTAGNVPTSEATLASPNNPGFNGGIDYGLVIGGVVNNLFSTKTATAGTVYTVGTLPAINIANTSATYDTIDSSNPLLGGTYSDTVTLTLTAQGV